MENKTIYLAIMTHGMSDFEQKSEQVQIKRKSKCRRIEDTYKIEERYEPRNPYIPPEIDYIQFISHAPLGSYNLSCPNDTSKSLSRLEHHISKFNTLHGEELSAKLIELDDEVSPISLRNMNERKELKRKQIDDESLIKHIPDLQKSHRNLTLFNAMASKENIYPYIEYNKSSDFDNKIISKTYSAGEKVDDMYVLSEKGGELEPNFETGIFKELQSFSLELSRNYNNEQFDGEVSSSIGLFEVFMYLQEKGYQRIIIIDYSCNQGIHKRKQVPRNYVIAARNNYTNSAKRPRIGGKNSKKKVTRKKSTRKKI